MLLAGGFSVIAGVAYVALAAGADSRLMPLVLYTAPAARSSSSRPGCWPGAVTTRPRSRPEAGVDVGEMLVLAQPPGG
jgi:hypothetical protein